MRKNPHLLHRRLALYHRATREARVKKRDFFLGTVREILMPTKKEERGIRRGKH